MEQLWLKGKSHERNTNAIFAGKFNISQNSILKLCAKNTYSIFINGKFLASGPSRCAHGRNEIDTFILSDYAGENVVICVEVSGYNVWTYQSTNDTPYFACEILTDNVISYSSADFIAFDAVDRLQKVARFSVQRAFSEYYVLNGDMRTKIRNGDFSVLAPCETEVIPSEILTERSVNYPTYETATAIEFEKGGIYCDENAPIYTHTFLTKPDENRFQLSELDRNVVPFVSQAVYKKDECGSCGKYTFYQFDSEITGFFKLIVDVSEYTTLYLCFNELLTEQAGTNTKVLSPTRSDILGVIGFELAPGHYELISAEPYSSKYASVLVLNGKADVSELSIIKYENPDARKLEVSCDNKEYELIIEAARNTFAQNAVDIFTDCPLRERAGWLCDSYFTAMAERLLTGKNIIERHYLENYGNFKGFEYMPDGMIPMLYPGDFSSERFIPNWAMWYVIELYDATLRGNDGIFNEMAKEKVLGLLDYFKGFENELGLLEKLESWVFVEWSMANQFVQDVNYPSNMLYCGMLNAASKLLSMPELAEKADKIRKTIRESAKSGIFYIDNAVRKETGELVLTQNTTETCQYYAFYFGIATPEEDAELFSELVTKFGTDRDDKKVYPNVPKSNAFIGNYLRLDYLTRLGYSDILSAQCLRYFGNMARQTGTLWEKDSARDSCNHGFASYAANILVMGLCGVRLISNKKIYTVKTKYTENCKIKFPCDDGNYVTVTVLDGKRTIDAPEGYEVV